MFLALESKTVWCVCVCVWTLWWCADVKDGYFWQLLIFVKLKAYHMFSSASLCLSSVARESHGNVVNDGNSK